MIFQITLSAVIFVLLPLGFSLSLPFLALQKIISCAAKIFRKELGNILPSKSALFAIDSVYESPKCNATCSFVIEGKLDFESVRSSCIAFFESSLLVDSEGNGRYQELKQYFFQWCGYYFWKTDTEFDPRNHLHSLSNDAKHTEKDLVRLSQECTGIKWSLAKPMWRVIFVPNYKLTNSEKSVLAFHHSIGDGYSILYLISNAICGKKVLKNVAPNFWKQTLLSEIYHVISLPCRASWELAEIIVNLARTYSIRCAKPYNDNDRIGLKETNLNIAVTNSLPLCLIKDTPLSHFNTSFATVLCSAISLALREFQIRKQMILPEITPFVAVAPYPGRKSSHLINHMSAVMMNLHTEEEDPVKLLRFSEKEYIKSKQSTLPTIIFYGMEVLGWHIAPVVRCLVSKVKNTSNGLSSFPVGLEHLCLSNYKLVECFASVGLLERTLGLGFVSITYLDKIRISIMGQSSKFSTEDVELLSSMLEQKLIELNETTRKLNYR